MMNRKILLIIAAVVVILIILGIVAMACKKAKVKSPSMSTSHSQSSVSVSAAKPSVTGISITMIPGETKVSWDPVEGADHYTMYYSPEKGFAKEKANVHDPITETSAIMGSDVPMGYYFRLSATLLVDGKSVETPLSHEYFMQLDAI